MPQRRSKSSPTRRSNANRAPRFCRFTAAGIKSIDYKDLDLLRASLTEAGKIIASRNSGVKARFQRQLTLAVKRARFLALLPYTDSHRN